MGMDVGGIAGFAYYKFVGCAGGNCPITSHLLNSSAYGALIGVLLFTCFKREHPRKRILGDKKAKTGDSL